jgi:hypothetical protein
MSYFCRSRPTGGSRDSRNRKDARGRSVIRGLALVSGAMLAQLPGPTLAKENTAYTYDVLVRLVVVSKAGAANAGSNAVYQYDNAGNRANVAVNSGSTLNSWYMGDFNGDGRSDILWRNDNGDTTDWLGATNGGYADNAANAYTNVTSDWHVAAVGDFNGDGRSDILWRNDNGAIFNFLGTANGGFVNNGNNSYNGVGNDWQIVGIGDFNGDGRADILWRHTDGLLTDWLGTANGGFTSNGAIFTVLVDPAWSIVATRDFNGDGRSDILWRHTSGTLSDWLGQTNGAFLDNGANAGASVDPQWKIIGTGDFNGDGRNDILWRQNDGTLSVWLANTNGSFSSNSNFSGSISTAWNVAVTGDINGDGRADILWRSSDGTITDWLGTTSGSFTTNDANALTGVPTSWHVEPRRTSPLAPAPPPASFSISDAPTIDEGANSVFTIVRVGTYETMQSVNYATASGTATSGSDFTATSGTLTFGPTDTQKTVAVPTIMDGIAEPAENLTMTISSPTAGATLGRTTATGVINASSAPIQPPVANGDSLSVGICDSGTVNVIANDTDPAGNYPLTLVSVGTSNIGQAVVADSATVYFSAGGSPGGANITYTVKNSLGATATGIISVTVTNGTGCM